VRNPIILHPLFVVSNQQSRVGAKRMVFPILVGIHYTTIILSEMKRHILIYQIILEIILKIGKKIVFKKINDQKIVARIIIETFFIKISLR